jgi:hypothetical protein
MQFMIIKQMENNLNQNTKNLNLIILAVQDAMMIEKGAEKN